MSKTLIEVIDEGDGKIDFRVSEPRNAKQHELLAKAAAMLLPFIAKEYSAKDCHRGCAFAGMIELAHKMYNEVDNVEYQRVVAAGLLTAATATGSAH